MSQDFCKSNVEHEQDQMLRESYYVGMNQSSLNPHLHHFSL